MARARGELPPTLAGQHPVHGGLGHGMPHGSLVGRPNLADHEDAPVLGWLPEIRQQGFFLGRGEILPPPPAAARTLERGRSLFEIAPLNLLDAAGAPADGFGDLWGRQVLQRPEPDALHPLEFGLALRPLQTCLEFHLLFFRQESWGSHGFALRLRFHPESILH